jgi:hypothetical protein
MRWSVALPPKVVKGIKPNLKVVDGLRGLCTQGTHTAIVQPMPLESL